MRSLSPERDLDQRIHLSVTEAPRHLPPELKKRSILLNIRNVGCMNRGRRNTQYRRERKRWGMCVRKWSHSSSEVIEFLQMIALKYWGAIRDMGS